jgi:hypothetical protein
MYCVKSRPVINVHYLIVLQSVKHRDEICSARSTHGVERLETKTADHSGLAV